MSEKFSLSKSNKIFFGVIATLVILENAVRKTSDQTGYVIGIFVGIFLIVYLLSWIVWRISGRDESYGSKTFNILFTIPLLVELGEIGDEQEKRQIFDALQLKKEKLQTKLGEAGDKPLATEKLLYDFEKETETTFQKLAAKSKGVEAKFYELMGEFIKESNLVSERWSDLVDEIYDLPVFDFLNLKNTGEITRLKDIINEYIIKTKRYRENFLETIDNLKAKLRPIGLDNQFSQGALKGARKGLRRQQPVLVPLLESHIEYGESIIELITFLDKHKSDWSVKEGELLFESDELVNEFSLKVHKIINLEDKINTLTEKLAALPLKENQK